MKQQAKVGLAVSIEAQNEDTHRQQENGVTAPAVPF